MLHRMGYRFRLHRKDLPGKPDIVLPKYNTVIFVHGCFWHRHEGCKYAYTPKSRVDFWNAKFDDTVARDERNREQLKEIGWNVVTIWECETKNISSIEEALSNLLSGTISNEIAKSNR